MISLFSISFQFIIADFSHYNKIVSGLAEINVQAVLNPHWPFFFKFTFTLPMVLSKNMQNSMKKRLGLIFSSPDCLISYSLSFAIV